MIEIGTTAPDFTLPDQNELLFQLSERKCGRVLLSFHPLAWTGTCHDEILSLEKNHARIAALDAIALAISVDSTACKKAWADSLGVTLTSLLSDFWPHGAVAKRYGIFRDDDGFSERANIIVDHSGKVIFTRIYPLDEAPDINEVLAVLEQSR